MLKIKPGVSVVVPADIRVLFMERVPFIRCRLLAGLGGFAVMFMLFAFFLLITGSGGTALIIP